MTPGVRCRTIRFWRHASLGGISNGERALLTAPKGPDEVRAAFKGFEGRHLVGACAELDGGKRKPLVRVEAATTQCHRVTPPGTVGY